ncbi:MAG TPA: hypothetical protein VK737_08435 [Opitutales bacterium]|jgi:hypothetical protein|nr:hypothetical protein [Opitutales bacterium]
MDLSLPEMVIGPLFTNTTKSQNQNTQIQTLEPLGVQLEMATIDDSFRIPLFHNACSYDSNRRTLTELLIPGENLPAEFYYFPFFSVQTQTGIFVPLESFLVGLYRQYDVRRSILSVLADLHEMVEFTSTKIPQPGLLIPEVENLGFYVTSIHSYGRRLSIDVDWMPAKSRSGVQPNLIIGSSAIDFRPMPDGTLGNGKWVQVKNCFMCVLLDKELRKIGVGAPLNLFTTSGQAKLLTQFEWTLLAKMNNKQARSARIEFLKQNLSLIEDHHDLAKAMQKAGLYSDSTTIWQIAKFLPSLIDAAKNRTE